MRICILANTRAAHTRRWARAYVAPVVVIAWGPRCLASGGSACSGVDRRKPSDLQQLDGLDRFRLSALRNRAVEPRPRHDVRWLRSLLRLGWFSPLNQSA